MISTVDKALYWPLSFNEQMAWIGEEVESLVRHNARPHIQEQGQAVYGEQGYSYVINRLFQIIKEDPKNQPLMREIRQAERDLLDFLYEEPGALSESEIVAYWRAYQWAYAAEIESQKLHYFLVKGYNGFNDRGEWIGIYHAWSLARDAYYKAVAEFEKEHQEIKVNIFDESTGKWLYNVEPQTFFQRGTPGGRDKFIEIECVINSISMNHWKLNCTKKDIFGYRYDSSLGDYGRRPGEEIISVRFEIDQSYEVFDLLEHYWGNFNECPDCKTMKEKAKQWHEKYGAVLIRMSLDTLTFECHKLSEKEVLEIIAEADAVHAQIIDCEPEEIISYMLKANTFTLWWD